MSEEKSLFRVRLEKLQALREMGIDPYPARFDRDRTAVEIRDRFDEFAEAGTPVSPAGRIMTIRRMGKACFAHLRDRTGTIQLYLRRDNVGEEAYNAWKRLEPGDWVGATGAPFRTKTGEMSIDVSSFTVLSKSLLPLPEKWHGLTNKEIRYRRRYLDLIANPEVVEVFRKRAALIRRTRRFLDERGFLEVETPALQPIYGGASARPFTTHHNALDMKLYLRIADELYLKRLIVGGLEKVYEIAKDFRNEGIDRTHNPEFTQLELYEAFRDYNDMMALVEDLLRELALELCGTTRIVYGGKEADLGRPWRRLSFVDALSERLGRPALETDEAELRRALARSGVEIPEDASVGGLMDKLFETWIEPGLEEPTFVIDHPKAISPLAKERPDRPGVVERFEPFLFGIEIGNAFSELNDPVEQRRRFEGQKRLAGVEGEEAQQMDEDFLRAVEHGMPPTGGLGLGIDRIAMILTDQPSIRDVLLFPQLRPEVPE